MNTFTIANAKSAFFNSKEEYLAFRQAWKDFHNSGKAKAEWKETSYLSWDYGTREYVKKVHKVKYTALAAHHYLLYNLLRGKPSHCGFFEAGNPTEGYKEAVNMLLSLYQRYFRTDIKFASDSVRAYHLQNRTEAATGLLLPFGNTISEETLANLLHAIHNAVNEKELEAA
jgi:hypothetical protein